MARAFLRVLPLLFLSLAFACGKEIEPGNRPDAGGPPVAARVETMALSETPGRYDAVGTVHAELSSTLASKLMGVVRKVNVREGDRVSAGDVLVEIDPRQVEAQAQQASAGLAEARQALSAALSGKNAAAAQEKLARTTFERYVKLMEKNSVSRQEYDEARARADEATAALAQAQAQVEAATHRVDQATAALAGARVGERDSLVTAPYDGVVTAKLVQEGDLAAPGTPLVSLEGTTGLRVDFLLPESQVQAVSRGSKVQVIVPGLSDRIISCEVSMVSPSADARSRSFLVQANLPPDPGLHSGMFARVEVPLAPGGLLLMPGTAVVRRGQLDGFFLVDKENRARFRLLRLGRTFGDLVEVLSGISAGDRYVASPPVTLTDGAPVQGAEKAEAGPKSS
ncbi:MAG: efflux RND transporter periplasmic adaptor subunit [Thermodesulfobacteriota bacterium]